MSGKRPATRTLSDWDRRYEQQEYVFGTAPNVFLAEHAHRLGVEARVLCVADGEGRNGAFLAGLGHAVTAFDGSEVATRKALALDQTRGVRVERLVVSLERWRWHADAWDAVVAVFVQFAPPAERRAMFAGILRSVRPGGLLLIEGYTPRQLAYGTGGPPDASHMYTAPMLQTAFAGWEVLELREYDAERSEGVGHRGMSALVDLVARRPVS